MRLKPVWPNCHKWAWWKRGIKCAVVREERWAGRGVTRDDFTHDLINALAGTPTKIKSIAGMARSYP